jgi:hypothetical protein
MSQAQAFVFIELHPFRIAVYGSLKELFKEEGQIIGRSLQTFYNSHDFDVEDYRDESCVIVQRPIQRSKQKPTPKLDNNPALSTWQK